MNDLAKSYYEIASEEASRSDDTREFEYKGSIVALPPCQNEDDTNCYWDAQQHGNGQGKSFFAIRKDDGEDDVIYQE